MSAKIVVSSSNTWLSGWMRPASAGASRSGSVTSMVSDASRASSAADFRTSRRAVSAWVTLSLARLIAAPCVLRSSGDILPSVASSAEIEPFLPSAATRTASSAASSPAAAIWARIVVFERCEVGHGDDPFADCALQSRSAAGHHPRRRIDPVTRGVRESADGRPTRDSSAMLARIDTLFASDAQGLA